MRDLLHVHTICYNEIRLMPHFLRHYSFADRIFVHDNFSTDGTREYLEGKEGVKVIDYHSGGELRDDLHLERKNNDWKASRGVAKWVVVCDVDELVYHPDWLGMLSRIDDTITVVKTEGWQMVSESFPVSNKPLVQSARHGYRDDWYGKVCLFRPDRVEDMRYAPGCHLCNPICTGTRMIGQFKLLHYSHVGREETWERLMARKKRLSEVNVKNGWGVQYHIERGAYDREFDAMLKKSVEVVSGIPLL